ncbi:MAG TPA: helix-turn-helix transcriptional regulator [Afifellaceae bacterium]|nr:helix-turn-helix transcriptional regulator [Afifellaceae bacterium]
MTEPSILNVLEAMGCGGLILDRAGRVLQTNEKARRYLGSEFQIQRRSTPSSGRNDPLQLALREALHASSAALPQLGEYITVPRPDARPLLLRRIYMSAPQADEDPTATLIVLDMEDCPQPDESLLRDVFLLTPAETRLARRLSRGDNLAEIAKDLGVRPGTLRVQLKTLFVSAGCCTAAQSHPRPRHGVVTEERASWGTYTAVRGAAMRHISFAWCFRSAPLPPRREEATGSLIASGPKSRGRFCRALSREH